MAEDFTLLGIPEFGKALMALADRADAGSRAAVVTGGHAIEARIKQKLTESKGTSVSGGRDARGRFVKNIHFASPPGQPPALVTGQLRRSVTVGEPRRSLLGTWETRTGPTAVYGRIQELGGVAGRGSVLPARPYVAPSVQELLSSGELFKIMRDAWAKATGV